jgi:hypothetical protein
VPQPSSDRLPLANAAPRSRRLPNHGPVESREAGRGHGGSVPAPSRAVARDGARLTLPLLTSVADGLRTLRDDHADDADLVAEIEATLDGVDDLIQRTWSRGARRRHGERRALPRRLAGGRS